MSEEQTETVEAPEVQAPSAPAVEPAWYDNMGLDDGTKGYVQTKGWKSNADLLKSYQDLERFRGVSEDRILKLPEQELPENMGDIYNRLGRPETPDGYQVDIPEGMKANDALLGKVKDVAHKKGVSSEAFKEIINVYNQEQVQANEAYEQSQVAERQAQEVALKNEWGTKYDESVFMAEKGMRELGLTDEDKAIIEVGMGYDRMMKAFSKIAKSIGEKSFHEGEKQSDFGTTPEMARHEIEQINAEAATDKAVYQQLIEKKGPKYHRLQQLRKIRFGE